MIKAADPIESWNASVRASPAHLRAAIGAEEIFWRRYGDVYLQNRTAGMHFRRVVQWLGDKVEDASLIEIGPGPGVFTPFLVEHCARVTAVEPSPSNVALLSSLISSGRSFRVKAERWEDVVTEPHDLVFSAGTLYVFCDIEAAIRKMLSHALKSVLLVTINEELEVQEEIASSLGLPPPTPAGPPADLFLDVLQSLDLHYQVESFRAEQEYLYPNPELVFDLLKGRLSLVQRHLSGLKSFLRQRGLLDEKQAGVRMPRVSTTCMVEIPV